MPMLTTKFRKLFILLLLFSSVSVSTCLAENSFVEQFKIKPQIHSDIADRITEYNSEDILLPLSEQKKELLKLSKKLDKLSSQYKNQAVYWFIRGLQQKNLAAFNISNKAPQLAAMHIEKKDIAYKKALQLSAASKNKLSAAIFSTMKHGLPQALKIAATKGEISAGGNGDNDSYYWYLHWSNIDQLEKAGRKEEAKKAYKTMQKELKRSGMDMSVYNSLTKKIETDTFKKSTRKDSSLKKHKKAIAKTEKKPPAKAYDTRLLIILSIIIFSLVSIIGVAIYDFSRKRKSKKVKK